MTKAIFIPAVSEQFVNMWDRGLKYKGKDGKEYDMKFFTKNSHFEMDVVLQSIYYVKNGSCKNKECNYKELIKYPNDKILLTDSAGFQIASFKRRGEVCDITAIDSLRWQEEIADVAMNLDVPPNLDGNPSYEDFIKALNESVENFKLFERERKNYKMLLLNVLHGETLEYFSLWYNKVKVFKFDGWAIGIKPPFDPMLQALGFLYLWEKGEFEKDNVKWLHFFGTSGKHVMPTFVYLATKLKKEIGFTFDSSSYNIGSIYRTYLMPFDFGPHLSFGDKFKTHNPHLKELPCDCPVCHNIKSIDELNTTDIYAGTLISLHNLYQYKYFNDILNTLVVDKELFIDYIKKINISERTLISIEFIDYCLEKGLENGVQKYKEWFNTKEFTKAKQSNIFSF